MIKTVSQPKRRHILGWLAISLFVANLIMITPTTESAQATKKVTIQTEKNSTREACPDVPLNWRNGQPLNPSRAYDCYCKKPTGKAAGDKNLRCVIDGKNFSPVKGKVFPDFITKIPDKQCPHIKEIKTEQHFQQLARCKMIEAMIPGSKKMDRPEVIHPDGYVCKLQNGNLISSNPKKAQSCLNNFHTIFYKGGSIEQSFAQSDSYWYNRKNDKIVSVK
jgi:hypothetical protein